VGWSLWTQRLELSASGMIAHTVFFLPLLAALVPPLAELPLLLLSLLPHAATAIAPAAASTTTRVNLNSLMWDLSSSDKPSPVFETQRKCFAGNVPDADLVSRRERKRVESFSQLITSSA
jgi:hypothetical protein